MCLRYTESQNFLPLYLSHGLIFGCGKVGQGGGAVTLSVVRQWVVVPGSSDFRSLTCRAVRTMTWAEEVARVRSSSARGATVIMLAGDGAVTTVDWLFLG